MTRSADWERLFKWVGPIIATRVVLLARKDRHLTVSQPTDLATYRIGVIREDIGHQLINTLGVTDENLQISSNAIALTNMLDKGRIDFWAYDETTAHWFIKTLELDNNSFETAYVLKEGYMYYAFSQDVDDTQLLLLQSGLEQLKQKPRYLKIINQYK